MTSPYHTKYGASMLLSTTIREEEEDDMNDATASGNKPQQDLERGAARGDGCATITNDYMGSSSSHRGIRDRRLSQLAAGAVSSIASATSRLVNRILHAQPGCGQHSRHKYSGEDSGKAVNAGMAVAASSAAGGAKCRDGTASIHEHKWMTSGSAQQDIGTSAKGRQLRWDSHVAQPQRPPQQPRIGHLVRLMDGDDVRLALQALQLAAQIHDHVWGPAGPTAAGGNDRRRREALLEAAGPLYDTAMATARAIQHRALHSLVKQAVRRYVNPCRGSPDDVLHVILELLTGCGGKAAAATTKPAGRAAAASAPPPPSSSSSRCFRDVTAGSRGGGGRSAVCPVSSLPRRLSEPECPPGCNGDSVTSRCSTNSQHQRISFGSSSLSGLSSTRSSFDSCGSDASACLPASSMLRA